MVGVGLLWRYVGYGILLLVYGCLFKFVVIWLLLVVLYLFVYLLGVLVGLLSF